MKLKLLSLLLILGLALNIGCSSSNDDESLDTEAAEVTDAELDGEEYVDEAGLDEEGSEVADEAMEDGAEVADDFAGDEEVVADTGDEEEFSAEEGMETAATSEALPEESLEDVGDSSQLVAEDGTGMEGTELADGSVSETPAPMEDTSYASTEDYGSADYGSSDYGSSDYGSTADAGYTDTPKWVPVKKIADTPFNKNGILVNTVYIARPGDDLNSISQKIFGADHTDQLLQANPNLAKGVKVGDKVYYNSPRRPGDSQRMLTYYEDAGLPAQTYVAQDGENIRVISKSLLGNENSWKEVWATNMAVESKDELAAGTELRYWPDGAVAAPVMAAAPTPAPEPAPMPEAPQMPEPAPADQMAAANDPMGMPQDDFALPDDMAGSAAGTMANVEPPPPPPPPPPAPAAKAVASNDEKDLTFMLSAGGLLLVGVGVLLGIIRKGRSRKMSMNTHTQI